MVKKDNELRQKRQDQNVIIINPEPLIRLEEGLQNIVKELKKLNEIIIRRSNGKESSN